MVLIDGHDNSWRTKFEVAASAICHGRLDLATTTTTTATSLSRNKDYRKRKIVFMHLNLTHVPWELFQEGMPWQPYNDNRVRVRLKKNGHCNYNAHDDDDDLNDDCGDNYYTTTNIQDNKRSSIDSLPPSPRFLGIEVMDCSGLQLGLWHIFRLPVTHLSISMHGVVNEELGRILSLGLRVSSWVLQEFRVSTLTWTPSGMKGLARGLQAATTLQVLDLSYTQFQWNGDANGNRNNGGDDIDANHEATGVEQQEAANAIECLESLARGLSKSQVVCLKLNRCRLKDDQLTILIREGLLEQNECLQELYLGGNQPKRQALIALAEYLKSPRGCSLVTLGLSNIMGREDNSASINTETSNILSLLYPALSVNRSLRVLHLASNFLHDEDMFLLCKALTRSQVTMLDLKSNCISNRGTQILAEHLPPQLERLWLLGNSIGENGAKALLQALERYHVNLVDLRIPVYDSFALVPELEALDEACHFYLLLNQGGRRILMEEEEEQNKNSGAASKTDLPDQHQPKVPLGLWPLVLERINRTKLPYPWRTTKLFASPEKNRAQLLYYMLQNGSILWGNK